MSTHVKASFEKDGNVSYYAEGETPTALGQEAWWGPVRQRLYEAWKDADEHDAEVAFSGEVRERVLELDLAIRRGSSHVHLLSLVGALRNTVFVKVFNEGDNNVK
jgi:hypothetical protein